MLHLGLGDLRSYGGILLPNKTFHLLESELQRLLTMG
jgi:hypothetical protein